MLLKWSWTQHLRDHDYVYQGAFALRDRCYYRVELSFKKEFFCCLCKNPQVVDPAFGGTKRSWFSKISSHNSDNNCQQYAEQYHCRDRKIKIEIFFFNSDISRKPADPAKVVVKEVNYDTHYHQDNTYNDNPFAGFACHRN